MVITLVVVGGCAVASLWGWAGGTSYWYRWGLMPQQVLRGEWYRLFTSVFFHADLTHLLVNAIVFLSFGKVMETYYGLEKYIGLLVAGTLGSGLLTIWRYQDRPQHVSIGLSGVVNAVLFAFILHNPTAKLLVFFLLPMPAWLFALLYVTYSLFEGQSERSYVNHWAHIGGAAAGIIFALLLS